MWMFPRRLRYRLTKGTPTPEENVAAYAKVGIKIEYTTPKSDPRWPYRPKDDPLRWSENDHSRRWF